MSRRSGEDRQEAPATEAAKADAVRLRISEAAARAKVEAEARRKAAEAAAAKETPPRELGGRAGPDPIRHGDWEVKGIASDF